MAKEPLGYKEWKDNLKITRVEEPVMKLGNDYITTSKVLKMYNNYCDSFHPATNEKKDKSLIHVITKSNVMRKALETVVRGYEDDGLEQMDVRDEIFYKTCKEALDFNNKNL